MQSNHEAHTPPTVLYIEDDPENALLVRSVLRAAGFEVLDAPDGLTGIELALRSRPAVILLDVRLPDVDGYVVAALLRTFPDLAGTPIVAVTAYTAVGDRERALVAGCDGFLTKPIDVDRLADQVRQFLGGRRERVGGSAESGFLRELNQRLVERLFAQLDELRALSRTATMRARRLEALHEAFASATTERGTAALLHRLLPRVASTLGALDLGVDFEGPGGTRITHTAPGPATSVPGPGTAGARIERTQPLVFRGQMLGSLVAHYAGDALPTPEDEHLFGVVANHTAALVANCALYEAERSARAAAESARQRATLLADASRRLGTSLDYETTVTEIVRLALVGFADACTLDLLEDDGTFRRTVAIAADPDRAASADVLARHPPSPDSRHWAATVVRSGEPQLIEDVPDELLGAIARDPEHLAAMLALRPRSVIATPLVARGTALGVLSFMSTAHRYDEDDLAVAHELGVRATMALTNAGLYRQTQEGERRKDRFLSMLAHELRTPLASVLNSLGVIRRRGHGEPAVATACEIAERQVWRQARLLDDLLDLTRIRQHKVNLERTLVDLAVVVAEAIETTRPLMEERQQRVSVTRPEHPVLVAGDPGRLGQVVVNLLGNAAKHGGTGGQIVVAIGRDARSASLSVRDFGAGISPDVLPRVFDLYTQAEPRGRQGGLGVGLAIVKQLVALHGGTVEAHSEGPGRGAQFTVRLPLAEPGERLEGPEPLPPPPAARRRVLIVEDDADARESLRLVLELDGHDVLVADSGVQAVETAAQRHPDVVLVDVGLPDVDGYEVARRIRRALGDDVALLAVTGHGRAEDVVRARDAGFDAHLLKPLAHEELTRAIVETSRRAA